MPTETLKFFGVSTPALMPDEMDADMSATPPFSQAARTARVRDFPDKLPVARPAQTPAKPAPDEKDWRCEEHGTTGWRGDHCRVCADLSAQGKKTPGAQPAGDLYQSVFGPGEAARQSDKYVSLENVLHRALEQASAGKGAARHATGQAFEDQPMQTISRLVGSPHGLLYQAIKKAQESTRMDSDAAVRELLGAINYLAGAIIFLESPK